MPSDALSAGPAGGPYRIHVIEPRPLAAEAFRRLVAGACDLCVSYSRTAEVGPGVDVVVFALAAGGVEAFRRVVEDPLICGAPVIAVSCHDDPQEKHDAFEAGAADFFVQFPDRLEVVARVRAHARRHRRTVTR